MKKALKIINRLEEETSNNKSNIQIAKRGDKIIYANKENHFLIQIIGLVLIIGPWCLIYFAKNGLGLFGIIVLIIFSIKMCLIYFKGSFQTNNNVEINLEKGEIKIIRKGFLGKSLLKDKIIKTKKNNEIIKEDVPYSDSSHKRITLKSNDTKMPLFDIYRFDSNIDQIFLSLKLLVKEE